MLNNKFSENYVGYDGLFPDDTLKLTAFHYKFKATSHTPRSLNGRIQPTKKVQKITINLEIRFYVSLLRRKIAHFEQIVCTLVVEDLIFTKIKI